MMAAENDPNTRAPAGMASTAAEAGSAGMIATGVGSWALAQPWGADGLGYAVGGLAAVVVSMGAKFFRDKGWLP